jgi:hypothetical protein
MSNLSYLVLEMKIWIYRSELNSWIFIYILYICLNKNWKIYKSEQSFTALGPEDRCPSWGLPTCPKLFKTSKFLMFWFSWTSYFSIPFNSWTSENCHCTSSMFCVNCPRKKSKANISTPLYNMVVYCISLKYCSDLVKFQWKLKFKRCG